MKALRIVFMGFMMFLFFTSAAFAGDFDWLQDLNIKAEADPSGFRAELSTRFKLGNAEINTIISNVEKPAEAYMVLRLGEMSQQPIDYVIKKYRSGKGHGWGVLAKSLGIKPGSREFHTLKRGHDLNGGGDIDEGNGRGRGRGRGTNFYP